MTSTAAADATTSDTLPRWDMSGVFPGLESREFLAATEGLGADLDRLAGLYDRHGVRDGDPAAPTAADLAAFDEVVSATEVAAEHAHALQQAVVSAGHLMSEAEESLYADLRLTGGSAWNRLHSEVTALLVADVDGRRLPITVVRGMATNPDPAVREGAYRAELDAWDGAAVPLAAAINAIKGEANTVNARRGWRDALAPALHANSVESGALEAMQEAAVAAFPDFRRFLLAKSRLLGHDGGLPWWDLLAPIPGQREVSWSAATAAVEGAFGSYSSQLAALAHRAVSERWVDAEPREGKAGGAFCMSVRSDESRVLLNFDGSFSSVQTLAHELGHAFHNTNLAGRTALQRGTPMALAETASIFCETIMVQAGLAAADDDQRLALLNVDLQGACQIVVDIHSRFLFERELSTRRGKGVLPVAELCQLMTDAQCATYGEALRSDALHRYMWAVKPHYYSSAFYNWPYCFGLLFGIGLYARYEQDRARFQSGYNDLLSSTGLATAAELAARFAIDITSVDFWAASLDVIRDRIADFERLVDRQR